MTEPIVIHTPTKEQTMNVLRWCEKQGIKWLNGDKATDFNPYYEEDTCLKIEDGILSYSEESWNESLGRKILTYREFLELQLGLAPTKKVCDKCGQEIRE